MNINITLLLILFLISHFAVFFFISVSFHLEFINSNVPLFFFIFVSFNSQFIKNTLPLFFVMQLLA